LPNPNHLAVLARPGFVRAAPTITVITRLGCPQLHRPATTGSAAKVSHLHSNHSASRRTHDLRHSYATGALKAGISPKVVSDRIGHANVGFFLQTYAHVLGNDDREAAEQAAAFLLGDGWRVSDRNDPESDEPV
jgi:integrase